jgi:hypothetical protein
LQCHCAAHHISAYQHSNKGIILCHQDLAISDQNGIQQEQGNQLDRQVEEKN